MEKKQHPVDVVWFGRSCVVTCSCPLMATGGSEEMAKARLLEKHQDQYNLVTVRAWSD